MLFGVDDDEGPRQPADESPKKADRTQMSYGDEEESGDESEGEDKTQL
jgi:hypothetical protein